ncbi:alpha-D-ribose 1-methylphosphonate 5-triphosphate diphosphatase [Kaistia dalseonensis]|uniref:Alpha-D-ribose 1-methylphosphonate 5-triphosphate diphosphatase n=1 Tax=Kaistia dalseonensis TaxID=410840 RepID=A0ABU0H8I7_9HYPH|nr:alpha-D-ribose 1-methylphosphonate 5-triphosphate diphosphatase [Kaistia dalseonensis]MCX5495997.1 alpha-D-ribose 1-methylphosphonate 5-triphosphate diphosphatase [Kaistia dalseonensis]MDQ0438600.1 alpha-D-ribose 1-methylphosphonate 5-triphosphate diphosphatase [Kaistia dalseonensis]
MYDPREYVLTNATMVLPDLVVENGWVAVADGKIVETGEGTAPERGFDLEGDYLVPGLVELHTDHLESHFSPRPHVRWHALASVMAYDAQIAAAGITTVFDSLRAGSDVDVKTIGADLLTLADAIDAARATGHLRVDHRTHIRCEIATPDVIEHLEAFTARYPVHLMSLMDHTPGQRQFQDLETWRKFYLRNKGVTEAQAERMISGRLELHRLHAKDNRARLIEIAEEFGAVLASHDDATAAHAEEAAENGVALAEFPTTIAAAEALRDAGIDVMMGGPNIVRGGSHSGNVAAEELARAGLLDILSSDYVPASLLMSAFELPRRAANIDLPTAIRTVTLTPAEATGLDDRGAIAPGLRADLVRVKLADTTPIVRQVWREGRRVS